MGIFDRDESSISRREDESSSGSVSPKLEKLGSIEAAIAKEDIDPRNGGTIDAGDELASEELFRLSLFDPGFWPLGTLFGRLLFFTFATDISAVAVKSFLV
jgi:hypothetical protein